MNAKEANRLARTGQTAAEKLEPSLRGKYEAVLRANARKVSKAYRDTGIVAAGKVPTLDEVLRDAALSASVTARTKVERQRIAEAAAHPIISDAGKQALRALLEPFVAAQAGVQAERIVAGVRDRVAAIMLEALVEGYSVPETARLLQVQMELDAAWQAEMLARTDLISLSNAGSHAAAESLEDGPKFKIWLSAQDGRVRPSHVEASGQVQPIGMPYVLAEGVELQYPGDPLGPDAEVINCRCVSVFTDVATASLAHTDAGGIHSEPVTAFDAPVMAAGFDESKVKRYARGTRVTGKAGGGRFAPKDGTSTAVATAEAEDQAKAAQAGEMDMVRARQIARFQEIRGNAYELGKLTDVELAEYIVWANQDVQTAYAELTPSYDEPADPVKLDEYYNRVAHLEAARLTEKQRASDVSRMADLAAQPLQPGEVGRVRRMDLASTNPVYAGELDGHNVVIKPENQLSATQLRTWVEPGFDLEREQAAAHVATLIDDPAVAVQVPAYRIMDVNGYGRAGIADYVQGETMARAYGAEKGTVPLGQWGNDLENVRLYDGIIGNTDRHEGNLMIDPAGRIHAIDHGLAFPSENQEGWPNVQGGVSQVPLTDAQRSTLERLRPRIVADTVLPTLLTDQQRAMMQRRIDFMLRENRLPTNDDWRNGWEHSA